MQLRDATLDDLETIVTIYNSTIPSRMVTADLIPISVDSRRGWFEAHSRESRPIWISEVDGKVAGWLSYSAFNQKPAYSATSEISIYLHLDFRGRGIGSLLVQKSIEHAPKLGITNLVGLIFGHNHPSLRLFQKFGFERWGFLPGVAKLDGVERDLVIVGKRI